MEEEKVVTLPVTRILEILVTIYTVAITVLLPLYHREGFVLIGDRKYRLFFVVSIGMLPVMLLCILVGKRKKMSCTDFWVLGYALAVLLSLLCSVDHGTALWGYEDWHMGAITQFMFIGIYIVVSKGWKWKEGMIKVMVAVSGVIAALGICNRYAIDPLGMFQGLAYWNKTHLLSTIGNINWYCSYMVLLFPLGIYYFWKQPTKTEVTRHPAQIHTKIGLLAAGAYVCLGFGTILTQGSTSGLVTLCVVMLAYGVYSFYTQAHMVRYMQLHVLLGGTALFLRLCYEWSDPNAIYFAADLDIQGILCHPIWVPYVIMSLVVTGWLSHFEKTRNEESKAEKYKNDEEKQVILREKTHTYKNVRTIYIVGALFVSIVGFVVVAIGIGTLDDQWGSGRGLLWKVTFQQYRELPWWRWLVGVGPDCYPVEIYRKDPEILLGFLAEWWGNAKVANAHNEWLNMLFNMGILGAVSYLGIFISTIFAPLRTVIRNKAVHNELQIPFVIGILAYMVNNSVSFQQVVSTPIVFVIMGMLQKIPEKMPKKIHRS